MSQVSDVSLKKTGFVEPQSKPTQSSPSGKLETEMMAPIFEITKVNRNSSFHSQKANYSTPVSCSQKDDIVSYQEESSTPLSREKNYYTGQEGMTEPRVAH